MSLNSPPDSGEEVIIGSLVIEIQIAYTRSAEDIISVNGQEQPQKSTKTTARLFKSLNELKSSPEPADDSATGFRAATFQWRNVNPKSWYILEGYDFLDSTYPKQGIASRSIRHVRKELGELVGRSRPPWARTVRRLRLEGGIDGVLRALIESETYHIEPFASKFSEKPLTHLTSAERFLTEFRQLGEIYRPLRTRHNLEQIILLQLHHAHLNAFSDFLQSFATDYAAPRMFMFDPRQAELRRWNLKAFVADSQLYRQLTGLGAQLTATAESLLDVVLALEDETSEDNTTLAVLGAQIRGCSKDITTRLTRMSDDLAHHIQLLSLSRDMNQSGNVQMLTLLATIFLPMSLSAGVLSMQSRFKDLGDLLYDFFGVLVLLAAVVALLLVAMFVFSSAKELESRLLTFHFYRKYLRPTLLATMTAITLILGALVLTFFVVGMFKDVVLGARILGYGIIAAIGARVVIAAAVLVVRWIASLMGRAVDRVRRWGIGGQKEKQNDLEGDLGRESKGKEAAVDDSKGPGVKTQAEPLASNGQDFSCTPPTVRAVDKSPEGVISNGSQPGSSAGLTTS